jgi:hypothetical protein
MNMGSTNGWFACKIETVYSCTYFNILNGVDFLEMEYFLSKDKPVLTLMEVDSVSTERIKNVPCR